MAFLVFSRLQLQLDMHSGIRLASLSKGLVQVAKTNSPTMGLAVLDWTFRSMMYRFFLGKHDCHIWLPTGYMEIGTFF